MPEKEAEETETERPSFKGCVFCYAAEMTVYGARKLKD
jgi:hypothetical protein